MPKLNLQTAARIKNASGEIIALKGNGFAWVKPAAVETYLATAPNWNASTGELPFGDATLSQANASLRPVLTDGRLVFTGDYLTTNAAEIMALAESGEVELSVLYRPTALSNGYAFSFGDMTTNSDNAMQLYMMASGQIRFLIDGTVGSGAQSFTTSMTPMVVGQDYLVTIIMSGGFITMRVNGVDEISNSAITGAQPSGLNIFALGCRHGATASGFCSAEITMMEVRAV